MNPPAVPDGPPPPASSRPRLESVDLLRGLVIILMALDHTRVFFHTPALQGIDPLDLGRTTTLVFLTRFLSHFCAPIFMFLAGTGAFLASQRGKPKREMSYFLLTRGPWLIFLELTLLMWFGWDFSIHPTSYTLATLWALGCSMVVLAGLIHLPLWAIAGVGVTMIGLHNATDRFAPADFGWGAPLWRVIHAGGNFTLADGRISVGVFYPLIPWVGVMAVGYSFGAIYRWEPAVRRRYLFGLGLGLIALFVLLRFTNSYGDPKPWAAQSSASFTLLSFINCQKYPPSLCYLLVILGPSLLFLGLFDGGTPRFLRPLLVFGRVPMFFYLLHLPLIHGLAVLTNWTRFGGSSHASPHAGANLPGVYAVWAGVVLVLYPACRWFADLKRRRSDVWLSYF